MMWGYYDGWSWFWMVALMILLWGSIVALVVGGLRSVIASRQTSDPALETLRRRFAAGEISQEEFEKTRRALQA